MQLLTAAASATSAIGGAGIALLMAFGAGLGVGIRYGQKSVRCLKCRRFFTRCEGCA